MAVGEGRDLIWLLTGSMDGAQMLLFLSCQPIPSVQVLTSLMRREAAEIPLVLSRQL